MKNVSFILIFLFLSGNAFSMGSTPPKGVSLLLVPAKPSMVQLGMDMASQQHALLMTYAETSPDDLFLHIWDGQKWLNVPQSSFKAGTFIKNRASKILIVGGESDLTASLIETSMVWTPEVLHLESSDVTNLLNQMGRLYNFDRQEWEWVASRYNLDLENLNQDRVKQSWYDQNKASQLPRAEKPWKKPQTDVLSEPPQTSLTPLESSETKGGEGTSLMDEPTWVEEEFIEDSSVDSDPAGEVTDVGMEQSEEAGMDVE